MDVLSIIAQGKRDILPAKPWQCLTHMRHVTENQAATIHRRCELVGNPTRFEQLAREGAQS